ncbi:hypothetical protein GLYMA_09G262500v4 [Glycine max]|nr:hypothetical protein GLYMA_09G262500v4 [Glycine max]KAG4388919.1 hypothetical protein GLYMA_09G262500v4 [Glycine max]
MASATISYTFHHPHTLYGPQILINNKIKRLLSASFFIHNCHGLVYLCYRNAVVTGANKGIGFGICKQLVSSGITVVLTARDEKRGLEAVEKLKEFGVSDDQVVFHQLDVTDPKSIESLANFIKTQFGKLDILVNNAGIHGAYVDRDALAAAAVYVFQAI